MIKYFAYAGLDFLLTPDEKIYFLEANPDASGVYFINLMLEYLRIRKTDKKLYRLNINFPKRFVESLIKFYSNYKRKFPNRIGIFFDKESPQFLQDEYLYLKNLLISFGYDSILFTSEHIMNKNNKLYVKFGDTLINVDLIISRADGLPENIEQPVINPPIVNKIVRNKLYLEYIVYNYLIKHGYSTNKYRLPKTVLIRDLNDLKEKSKLDIFGDTGYILKPISGRWGLDIIIAKNRKQLMNKISRIGAKWFKSKAPFILQEWIPVKPFRAGDRKEYVYDIRIYALNGELAGGFCRRAPKPLNSKYSLESRYISNITRGGSIINLLIGCNDYSIIKLGEIYITSRDRIIFVDAHGLCINKKILDVLTEYTTIISKAIEEEVKRLLKGEKIRYPEAVIP